MNNKKKRVKKIITITVISLLLITRSSVIYGQITPPGAPEAPSVPTPPENENETPDAPDIPGAPDEPEAPTLDEILDPEPTPTSEPETDDSEAVDDSSGEVGENDTDPEQVSGDDNSETGNDADSENTGVASDGQVGDTEVETGDATNSTSVVNDLNSNVSAGLGSAEGNNGSGVSVVNNGNGSDSVNNGSAMISDNNTQIQDNSAQVVNNLDQESNSGNNSASENVGNSEITTGDANTTGTVVNNVNTNVDGISVSEFNIVDNHVGDVILDFSEACIQGCGGNLGTNVENSQNGSGSQNSGQADLVTDNMSFQNNDAEVENNVILASNSGDNNSDNNTGGDSEISTGDANVAANVLNFVNNNLAGNVVYAVVNVFGDLVGDIIFPDGTIFANTGAIEVENSGNGAESENFALVDQSLSDETFQFNDVNIENNLIFDANTGENSTAGNTGGDSGIETGEASVEAQVVNVANTNIDGGNWWLVVVNEAGQWIGKILGAPAGSLLAGSEGMEITTDDSGEISVSNLGNGADSSNNASYGGQVNNTLVQNNNASVVNNLDLSANTGGNSASRNTGGDSSISTGDASIVANIVNFVNNNIAGDGKLFVTVVNVFGSWVGDFVTPGSEVEEDDQGIGGDGGSSGDTGGDQSGDSHEGNNEPSFESGSSDGAGGVSNDSSSSSFGDGYEPTPSFAASDTLAMAYVDYDKSLFGQLLGSIGEESSDDDEKEININLAWLLPVLPVGLMLVGRRRFSL